MNLWNIDITAIKKCFLIAILILLAISCREAGAGAEDAMTDIPEPGPTEQDYGLYGIESGVVIRVFKRDSTREEIYFDRWGCRQARYEYVHMQGEHAATLWGVTIDDGSISHYVSLDSTYFSVPNDRMSKAIKWDSLGFEKERDLVERGYVCNGTKEVEGKLCKVWEYVMDKGDTMRSYIYKGVLLKETEYRHGKYREKEIGISLQENVKIPEEKFAVPKGSTAMEVNTIKANQLGIP